MIREEKKIICTQVCDICRIEESYEKCTGCGIDICPDCIEVFAKHYRHSIHVSGSGDALYCDKCQNVLKKSGNEKFALYLKMDFIIKDFEKYKANFAREANHIEREILKHGT